MQPFEIKLSPWGTGVAGGDGYDVVCSRGRYAARADVISWLGGVALFMGFLISGRRLRSRLAIRKSASPA
jgi:hypothetical protein